MSNTLFDVTSIDNNALTAFGIQSLTIASFKLPPMKDGNSTSYINEGFQILPFQYEELEFEGVVTASSFEVFTGYIFSFYIMLMGSGLRSIQGNSGVTFADSFFGDGVKVRNLFVHDDGNVCAKISFKAYIKECTEINAINDLEVSPDGFSAVLNWSQIEGASSYKVYRRLSGEANYVLIATISDSTYQDDLTVAGTYQYVVTALNVSGIESDQSNEVEIDLVFFTSQWDTNNAGVSGNTFIQLPIPNADNISVDWGDGVIDSGNVSHDYSGTGGAGIYTVRIAGTIRDWAFVNGGDRLKLLDISTFGGFQPTVFGVFHGCANIDITATDHPDLSQTNTLKDFFKGCSSLQFNASIDGWTIDGVESLESMFDGASSFNQSLVSWNVDSVTNFYRMFRLATTFDSSLFTIDSSLHALGAINIQEMFRSSNFNQDVSGWNTINITSFSTVFRQTPFNQNINAWDTRNVLSTRDLFRGCPDYNQPMDNWDMSANKTMFYMFNGCADFNQDISGWNTAEVTNMEYMFTSTSFNHDISGWNVGLVTKMVGMFRNSAFNQDISGWNIASLTDANLMFDGGVLSTANYDALLDINTGWPSSAPNNDVVFHAGTTNFTFGGDSALGRSDLINNHNWTITDGGAV